MGRKNKPFHFSIQDVQVHKFCIQHGVTGRVNLWEFSHRHAKFKLPAFEEGLTAAWS
jgi:hypothetical protein